MDYTILGEYANPEMLEYDWSVWGL